MITDENKAEYYQALLSKKTDYEGVFFVGVTTTGVFCRPAPRESRNLKIVSFLRQLNKHFWLHLDLANSADLFRIQIKFLNLYKCL